MVAQNSNRPLVGHPGLRLFTLSLTGLFLELLMIRWAPSQVRLIAYYANLMLISSFLGLGAGAMIAPRNWNLRRFTLPIMGLLILLLFQSQGTELFASEDHAHFFAHKNVGIGQLILVEVFVLNTLLFIPIGEQIGALFEELPRLPAYTWDLCGSLAGTLLFALVSATVFTPRLSFGIVLILHTLVTPRRWLKPTIFGVCIIGALIFTIDDRDAIWSKYHYITIEDAFGNVLRQPEPRFRTRMDPVWYRVRVNQDFYQYHTTLNPARYTPGGLFDKFISDLQAQYMLPYQIKSAPKRVLVLGAGGGLDVEAALLAGAQYVDAVDIDPALVGISKRLNPSGVYNDPRVHVHIDDARAFLERATEPYDAVVFGFLDSQTLFSYGSSLRQDSYTYTVESFRRAFELVKHDGLLSVTFSVPRDWVGTKLDQMLHMATGVKPACYRSAVTEVLLVSRARTPLRDEYLGISRLKSADDPDILPPATDDWPYLYLKQRVVPVDYLIVILTLLVICISGMLALRGSVQFDSDDLHFFFLGVGFLLLQTKSIGDCSLYFGTTWVVSLTVICGTLGMVLAANFLAMRLSTFRAWYYIPLFFSIAIIALAPKEWVLAQEWIVRVAWSLLVVPLPIFFAGLIFSTTFRQAHYPSAAFGANLIGATIGGFCEYLGMALGTHALVYIVLAAYLASLSCKMFAGRRSLKRLTAAVEVA